ncbi:MAG: Ig-like domain-containing protein [ANME-2 cluster archaeon]|nr:Ig-like domain-containing protein [ANME-2 cluster archaeon]
MQLKNDERAVTVTIESILLFCITVMLLGMVMLSFQSINEQASETVMREQYASIGNDIASKLVDMDVEIKASLSEGSVVAIRNEVDLPSLVADKPYEIELSDGNIVLRSLASPSVTMNIPFDPDINVVPGSKVHSMVAEHALVYDPNGQIMFENGGVAATPDDTWPQIYIMDLPPGNRIELQGTETIRVDTWDDIEVSKVEYYIDAYYQNTVSTPPFSWVWNTNTTSDGTYTITAVIYDRAGHFSYDTRIYIIDNGIDLVAPTAEIVSPLNGSTTDFNPPLIEAKVMDNIAIDNSSIELWFNSVDVTANATITNTSLTEYTIQYTPPAPLAVAQTYDVYVYAAELFYGVGNSTNQNVTLEWNFTVVAITDTTDPILNINFPVNSANLVTGQNIRVTYDSTDNTADDDSGIDYFVINVTYNSSTLYNHTEIVTTYPTVTYFISGTWEFPQVYVLNGVYEYNMTVYDRAGNSAYKEKGPFTVLTGQASNLIVDTTDTNSDARIITFTIRSSGPDIDISGMYVTSSTSAKLTKLEFGGTTWWLKTAGQSTPYEVPFGSLYRVPTTDTPTTLTFKADPGIVDITIRFDDGTTQDVSITNI